MTPLMNDVRVTNDAIDEMATRMNDDVAGGAWRRSPAGRGGGAGKISQVIERLENEYGNAIARSRG